MQKKGKTLLNLLIVAVLAISTLHAQDFRAFATNFNSAARDRMRSMIPMIPADAPTYVQVFVHDQDQRAVEYQITLLSGLAVVHGARVKRTGETTVYTWPADYPSALTLRVQRVLLGGIVEAPIP